MVWIQKEIRLEQRRRGFQIITSEILNQIPEIKKIKRMFCTFLLLKFPLPLEEGRVEGY
jgi:thiamine phosphate synthase YjbQ (UPF0047 family)